MQHGFQWQIRLQDKNERWALRSKVSTDCYDTFRNLTIINHIGGNLISYICEKLSQNTLEFDKAFQILFSFKRRFMPKKCMDPESISFIKR